MTEQSFTAYKIRKTQPQPGVELLSAQTAAQLQEEHFLVSIFTNPRWQVYTEIDGVREHFIRRKALLSLIEPRSIRIFEYLFSAWHTSRIEQWESSFPTQPKPRIRKIQDLKGVITTQGNSREIVFSEAEAVGFYQFISNPPSQVTWHYEISKNLSTVISD